ncbi:nucleotidyltransferase domain-containing protein [Aeromonas veronii]|uniref:nucleotidyltransferase domain-containing protein n=1 Tax=Aeromonas veronii TaxID=654 RepID=UPI00307E8076
MKHGAAHPAIDAGVVVGSLAKGKADRVSDVDLLLLAEPGFHKQGDELVRTIVGGGPFFTVGKVVMTIRPLTGASYSSTCPASRSISLIGGLSSPLPNLTCHCSIKPPPLVRLR